MPLTLDGVVNGRTGIFKAACALNDSALKGSETKQKLAQKQVGNEKVMLWKPVCFLEEAAA